MPRAFLACAIILTATGLAGCSTVSSRISEKPAAFATLPPQTQVELRQGVIHVGDGPDAVYIALGNPSSVEHGTHYTTWYYNRLLPASLARHDVSTVYFEKDRVVEIRRRHGPQDYPELDPFPRNPDRERSFN